VLLASYIHTEKICKIVFFKKKITDFYLQTFQCDTNRTFSAEPWVTDTFIMFMNAAPDTTCIAATVLRGRTFTYTNRN
jgi:hypothetical protein